MQRRTFVSVAVLSLLAASSRAQSDDQAFLDQFEKTFEPAGNVPAKDFVPQAAMEGALHRVRPMAFNDGLNNTYFMDAPEGVVEITGTAALLVRIREIYAIDYLRGLSKTEEFAKALAKNVGDKVGSAVDIVRDPFGTVRSIPKGASRFFGRVGEGMKGGKSNDETGTTLQGLTGTTAAKARLAAELGVDPYSTNEALQRELTGVAQAVARGGLVVNAATSVATGGAGIALTAVGVNQTLQDTLTNATPDDLRIINRKKLFALGLDRTRADEFLMHPWYSPWHDTIITEAMATIGVDPSEFLEQACRALTTEDAFYFQRLAQILARYHSTKTPLQVIRMQEGLICGIDRKGTMVVPLSCDYAIWAERAARRAEEFSAMAREHQELEGLALWVDGRVSDRLAQELATRKIALKAGALRDR